MAGAGRAQTAVRRILVYAILYALVIIAGIGLAGLLERALDAGSTLVDDDSTGLALSLAFTVIAAPLAGLLWWWQRRRFADPQERSSLVWALYVALMSTNVLIAATSGLAIAAAAGIDGRWDAGAFASGVVWAGVWVWHRSMRRSAVTAPLRLPFVPVTLGAVFGLAVATIGSIAALAALIRAALAQAGLLLVASQPWYLAALQALVWAVIGAVVWWWHWSAERGRTAPGAFAPVALVIVVGAAAATALFGAGATLFVVLRLLFDDDPFAEVTASLDVWLAAALIGGIVWAYHSQVVVWRSEAVRRGARLVVSAVALIGAASGFGVVVNALLASLSANLVEDDPRTILLGGLSAMIIGVPAWWLAWQPTRATTADEAADRARRVYLVTIFGASAIVAIVSLLIIGFRVFEFALGSGGTDGLVERIRAPFGLLAATAVVFGYHFALWRRDRAIARPAVSVPAVGRVILVAESGADELVRGIRAATGAPVSVWSAAGDDRTAELGDLHLPAALEAIRGLAAPRLLVLGEAGGGVRAVPLEEGAARASAASG
ncbi:DUF5671 domain-containing protein [Microbacterium sp. NPDC019599]|uniref:DUF5671 domain-containing protein n=1 Tax=Microbacterium sp. NPDC019599 TaxID=3154690 RepID=UPI0033FBC8F3